MKKTFAFLLLAVLMMLTGCAKDEDNIENTSETGEGTQEKMIPVSQFVDPTIDFTNLSEFKAVNEYLYYVREEWNPETVKMEGVINRKSASSDLAQVEIADYRTDELVEFLADREGNVYTLYIVNVDGKKIPHVKKVNNTGKEIYCLSLEEHMSGNFWNHIYGGVVDTQGRICFFSLQKEYYLFDDQGQFLKKGKADWSAGREQGYEEEGVVDAGEAGCYLYVTLKGKILFQKLDMEQGASGRESVIEYDNQHIPPVIRSGYEKGILIAEDNTLWSYNPHTQEKELLVDFLSEYVNIKGNQTVQIGLPDSGEIIVYLYDNFQFVSEQAVIRFYPPDQVAPKQTVVLGTEANMKGSLEDWVKGFNRQSMDYKVVIKDYSLQDNTGMRMFDFYKDILDGNAADLIDLSYLSPEDLTSKGMLEELEPYFEQSETIGKEDILPSIWQAGTYLGKMYTVIPRFQVKTMIVRADDVKDSTWTAEEYIELVNKYPQSAPLGGKSNRDVLSMLMTAELGRFVDWEGRTADFEQEGFIRMLEFVQSMDDKETGRDVPYEERGEFLRSGMWTAADCWMGDTYDYINYKDIYGEQSRIMSFPNQEEILWYPIRCEYNLAISSSSKCKEGAWAFLEYLLSDKVQLDASKPSFPAGRDAFEAHLVSEKFLKYGEKYKLTREEMEIIREMADNAYYDESFANSNINSIIAEETKEFLDQGKSPEETAKIIQNRVQLYLNE